MDTFQRALNFVKEQTNIGCGLIALLTAGGEKIFSTNLFKCPCSQFNFAYGMIFLMVPALALLVMGYLLNQKTWKLMTGLCLQKSKLCQCKKLLARIIVFYQITATAAVAPFSWIGVALLDGSYFECAMTGLNVTLFQKHLCGDGATMDKCRQELHTFPCGGSSLSKVEDSVLANIRAESQIIGWMLIASIILCNLALMCFARCHSPVSFHHLKFWQMYRQQESNLLESYSAQHAKELADRNVKSFFQQQPPDNMVTPPSKAWQNISSFYRFRPNEHFYSPMHEYVEHPDPRASIRSHGPCLDNPLVLGFVDQGVTGM
ncbi:unnamed protein product [Boreogadus saida]